MNTPPLNDLTFAAVALTESLGADLERNAVIAAVLPEVARCGCELCNPAPLHVVWREHAQTAAIREAIEHLRADAAGRALEVLEAAL